MREGEKYKTERMERQVEKINSSWLHISAEHASVASTLTQLDKRIRQL